MTKTVLNCSLSGKECTDAVAEGIIQSRQGTKQLAYAGTGARLPALCAEIRNDGVLRSGSLRLPVADRKRAQYGPHH